ncbi:MAG TPA: nuclear transport factor 2 family protein [Fimbriimonas sp.]|nr:nuclear transport factor 2 family protein [Fimbriimonas sp.]
MIIAVALVVAFPGSDAKVRAVLMRHYQQVTVALQKRDVRILRMIMAPDFLVATPAGKANRDEVIRGFDQQSKAMKDLKWDRKIMSLHVKGGTAVAVVKGHLTAKLTGPTPHTFQLDATTTDTWKKAGSDWKLKSSSVSSSTALVDGKPMRRPRPK